MTFEEEIENADAMDLVMCIINGLKMAYEEGELD